MRTRRMRGRRFFVVFLFASVLASAAYAFTATNTMPAGATLGDGSNTISGYTVSAVVYSLNATNPQNLDQVAFTISPTTATTVKIKLAAAGSWYTCTNTAGSVTCATTSPQATVVAATQLTVVAAQ